LVEFEEGHCGLIDRAATDVEAKQAFFGVDFSVKLEHFVQIVFVYNNAAIFFLIQGHTKTGLDVYILAI